jgi:hypothetical protein
VVVVVGAVVVVVVKLVVDPPEPGAAVDEEPPAGGDVVEVDDGVGVDGSVVPSPPTSLAPPHAATNSTIAAHAIRTCNTSLLRSVATERS